MPTPKESRRSVKARDATAPAATAAQETPATLGSPSSLSRITSTMISSRQCSCRRNTQQDQRFLTANDMAPRPWLLLLRSQNSRAQHRRDFQCRTVLVTHLDSETLVNLPLRDNIAYGVDQ